MRDIKSQYPDKVNVWAEIIENHLIDSFFDGNFNSEMYESMLTEQIIPAIRNFFPNNFDRGSARWSAYRIKGTKVTR